MIETRGASVIHALGLVPSPVARHLQRVGRSSAMNTQRTVDGAPTPQSPDSTLVTASMVPPRSARRATARRASSRRATARERKDDVQGRIIEYLKDHPQSTTGDIAKALNANRDTIAAELSHIDRASDVTKG
jgi:capsid protein